MRCSPLALQTVASESQARRLTRQPSCSTASRCTRSQRCSGLMLLPSGPIMHLRPSQSAMQEIAATSRSSRSSSSASGSRHRFAYNRRRRGISSSSTLRLLAPKLPRGPTLQPWSEWTTTHAKTRRRPTRRACVIAGIGRTCARRSDTNTSCACRGVGAFILTTTPIWLRATASSRLCRDLASHLPAVTITSTVWSSIRFLCRGGIIGRLPPVGSAQRFRSF